MGIADRIAQSSKPVQESGSTPITPEQLSQSLNRLADVVAGQQKSSDEVRASLAKLIDTFNDQNWKSDTWTGIQLNSFADQVTEAVRSAISSQSSENSVSETELAKLSKSVSESNELRREQNRLLREIDAHSNGEKLRGETQSVIAELKRVSATMTSVSEQNEKLANAAQEAIAKLTDEASSAVRKAVDGAAEVALQKTSAANERTEQLLAAIESLEKQRMWRAVADMGLALQPWGLAALMFVGTVYCLVESWSWAMADGVGGWMRFGRLCVGLAGAGIFATSVYHLARLLKTLMERVGQRSSKR